MKVLYAEDDDALRPILEDQLYKWGYTVLSVADDSFVRRESPIFGRDSRSSCCLTYTEDGSR